MRRTVRAMILLGVALCGASIVSIPNASGPVPGRCEIPVTQRTSENGCYVSATVRLGELPSGDAFSGVAGKILFGREAL
jgi:hypothetical protein